MVKGTRLLAGTHGGGWPNPNAYVRCAQIGGNAPYWRLPIAFDMRAQSLEVKIRIASNQNRLVFFSTHDGQILLYNVDIWPNTYFRYYEPAGSLDVKTLIITGAPVTFRFGPDGYSQDHVVQAVPASSFADPSATRNNVMIFSQNGQYRSSGDIYHVTVRDGSGNYLLACYPRVVDGVACLWDAVADVARGFSVGAGGTTADVTYGEDN